MKKFRTINALYKEIIEEDPGCALTKTALRRLVATGAILSRKVGSKFFITKEDVENYLEGNA